MSSRAPSGASLIVVAATLLTALVLLPSVSTSGPPGEGLVRDEADYAWSPGFHRPDLNRTARAIVEFDDGSGDALYVLGGFDHVGDVGMSCIARLRRGTWEALSVEGFGLAAGSSQAPVNAFEVFDDGSGGALYAGGYFTAAGSTAAWSSTVEP